MLYGDVEVPDLCFWCVGSTAAAVHPMPAGDGPIRFELEWLGVDAERARAPSPAGRVCLLCPALLSRWNIGKVCAACERENRDLIVPLVFGGGPTAAKMRRIFTEVDAEVTHADGARFKLPYKQRNRAYQATLGLLRELHRPNFDALYAHEKRTRQALYPHENRTRQGSLAYAAALRRLRESHRREFDALFEHERERRARRLQQFDAIHRRLIERSRRDLALQP